MTGALEGLRVLDLSGTMSGALATQLLADFGADVVQVEPPGGSPLRKHPAFPVWGRGKRSIVLDLKDESDRDTFRGLARSSDVLVESFRPGVMDRLGLGYDALSADNPRLVYTSITGFGQQGPERDLQGYEAIVMAKLGGFEAFGGMSPRPGPSYVSVLFCSYGAAQTALHGTLAALCERENSGVGQRVETSLVQGVACQSTWNWFLHWLATQYPDAFTHAPRYVDGVPTSGMFFSLLICLTDDGRWLQFSQTQPRLFRAFLRALDLDWMFDDPDWEDVPYLHESERRAQLWVTMLEAARTKTLDEWRQVFDNDHNVWAEVFRCGAELLDHPQLLHDGSVVTIDDPSHGPVRQPGALVRMELTPATLSRPAPRCDEHGPALKAALAAAAVTTGASERAIQPAASGTSGEGSLPSGLPLDGVTILELGTYFAAPHGATMLTDLGARVIKIEPLEGEPMRTAQPFPEAGAAKLLQGKESVAVDMASPEGREIINRIARRSDLVLQSFRAGVAERHAIDAKSLREVNPDLVYLNAPGYGVDGPCGDRPAFAPTIGAGTGLAMRNIGPTVPERPGLRIDEIRAHSIRLNAAATTEMAQSDGIAALAVGTGLLLGLLTKRRTGVAQTLMTTMLMSSAHALSDDVFQYDDRVAAPTADDQLYGLSALYRLYETSDGWIFLAAPTEREWTKLLTVIGDHPSVAGDRRFAAATSRVEHDEALAEALGIVFATRPAAEWECVMRQADVGCVEVQTASPESILMSDEFGRASGHVVDVDHPSFGEHPRLAPFVRFSRSSVVARAACLCGQHTVAVLREFGYSDETIDDHRQRGIIAGDDRS